jgi:hypothetical protein
MTLITDTGAMRLLVNPRHPIYALAAFNRALSDQEMCDLTGEPETLFASRTIWVPAGAAPSLPSLSLPRAKAGSITSSGWISQVTAS